MLRSLSREVFAVFAQFPNAFAAVPALRLQLCDLALVGTDCRFALRQGSLQVKSVMAKRLRRIL